MEMVEAEGKNRNSLRGRGTKRDGRTGQGSGRQARKELRELGWFGCRLVIIYDWES
jgi:hypothetical protein